MRVLICAAFFVLRLLVACASVATENRDRFVVVGLKGASVRKELRLNSPIVRTLRRGTVSPSELAPPRHHMLHLQIPKPLTTKRSSSGRCRYVGKPRQRFRPARKIEVCSSPLCIFFRILTRVELCP